MINMLLQVYIIIIRYSDVLIKEFEQQYLDKIKNIIEDKKVYVGVMKIEKMCSVIDVWKDFFRGQYVGCGFFYWIVFVVLVDIVGFIFFDIVFVRRD